MGYNTCMYSGRKRAGEMSARFGFGEDFASLMSGGLDFLVPLDGGGVPLMV